MTPLEIAKQYFTLSNKSDISAISELLTDSTTYSSQVSGIFLGKDDIVTMQKEFHEKFKFIHWTINSVKELKPGIILFDYEFNATDHQNNKIKSSGIEYVIVKDGKIHHIEIKGK